MKKIHFLLLYLVAIGLVACNQKESSTAIPTLVLDSGSQNQYASAGVSASAQVVPVNKVDLSFPMTGTVKSVLVELGDDVSSGQILVTLDSVYLEAEAAEAQANLAGAESQFAYLKRVGTDEEHLKSAQADVDRAQAVLDAAEARLSQADLIAPFSGTIAVVDIAPAETVVPGQVVVVLGDLTAFQIETTDLSERDVPYVKVGQPVEVFIEALSGWVAGKVVDIGRRSTTVGGDVVYQVTIELKEQPVGLLWGMSAEVVIQTRE